MLVLSNLPLAMNGISDIVLKKKKLTTIRYNRNCCCENVLKVKLIAILKEKIE